MSDKLDGDPFLVEDTIYEILQSMQNYLEAQDEICRHLSNGIFSMTMARKQKGIFIAKPDDIREDLIASTKLSPSAECDTYSLLQSENMADLLHICALPPPPLRKAQQEFRQSLLSIIQAQSAVRKLLDICETHSPMVVNAPNTMATDCETLKTEKSFNSSISKKPEKINVEEENEREEEDDEDDEDDDSDEDGGFENDDAALPEILDDSEDDDDDDDDDA